MTLSKKQKKFMHAALIGFVTGALTSIQLVLAVPGGLTERKAVIAFGIGVLTAGLSRMAGALLDAMSTSDSPNVPPVPQ